MTGFPSGSAVKNPLAVYETQKMWLQSLGWEDLLEQGTATHSSILDWRIPMDRGAWWAGVHRVAKSGTRPSDLAAAAVYYGFPWWLRKFFPWW